jgi:hypothetical protein
VYRRGDRLLTPRQVEALLPVDYSRGTVRAALQALVRAGRAEGEGDVTQMRYRRTGAA